MDIHTVLYAALVLFVAYLVRGIAGFGSHTAQQTRFPSSDSLAGAHLVRTCAGTDALSCVGCESDSPEGDFAGRSQKSPSPRSTEPR